MKLLFAGSFSLSLVLGMAAAHAQDYPAKPIRILTSAPGGVGDFLSRIIAQGIAGPLGQSVIVENRPTILSIEQLPKAAPDGYTLLVVAGQLWTEPLLHKTTYDPVRDFAPITLLGKLPVMLVVHPSLQVRTVKELIALAKAKPGQINYGSGGVGGSNYLAGALFKSMAGVDIVNVSYKGGAYTLNGLLGGEVQMMFEGNAAVKRHIESGRLRALAVTSAEPSALFPGLPTISASGLPGYEAVTIDSMFAPAKTPVTIITRLNQETVRFLNTPEARERLMNFGMEVVASSPEGLAAQMNSEMARWSKALRDAGYKRD